jgi:hypothetical protein
MLLGRLLARESGEQLGTLPGPQLSSLFYGPL